MENTNKVDEYLSTFKKKFKSFQSRAPVYFTFQTDQLNVYIQEINSTEILTFPIDYKEPVGSFIDKIKNELREKLYPKMIKREINEKDPRISEIQDEIDKGLSFNEAFKKLSKEKVKIEYLIDKIDLNKNRLVVLKENEVLLYKMDIPVIVFLKRIRSMKPEDIYKYFEKHSEKLEK